MNTFFIGTATFLLLAAGNASAFAADLSLTCQLTRTVGGTQSSFTRRLEIFFETRVVGIYDNYGSGFTKMPFDGMITVADNAVISYLYDEDASDSSIDRTNGSFYGAVPGNVVRGTCSQSTNNPSRLF